MPLRRKLLIILFLMTVVPFLVLLFGVVNNIEKDLETRLQAELHGTLDKMSSELTTLLNSQKSLAMGLARVPAVKQFAESVVTPDHPGYAQYAIELEAFFMNYQNVMKSIQALRFIDTEGKTLVKVKEGLEIPAKHLDSDQQRLFVADQSSKPFFRYAIAAQSDVSISDFELGRVDKKAEFCPAMLRYSVPIKDELDTFQGLLVVNMWGTRVDKTVEASLGGYPGNVYIVEVNDNDRDRDGIYLYHKNTELRFANQVESGKRLSQEIGDQFWQQMSHGPVRGSINFDDKRMFFYTRYQPYSDRNSSWLLVIEVTRDVVFAPIYSLEKYIWGLMFILLVLSLIISYWLSERIAGPVHNLADVITRYSNGDKEARVTEPGRDEICVAGKAFNVMCDHLEKAHYDKEQAEKAAMQSERLAAVGQLAAGVGHEINNPVMNIMSLANLIERSLDEEGDDSGNREQIKKDLSTLQKEGRRCSKIVQGILNFARANEPSYQNFELSTLIEDTINLMHHHFIKKDLKLIQDLQPSLIIEGDSSQLQQVLVNLILNAIYTSPVSGEISISAKIRRKRVHIIIEDNGAGIDDKDMHRVFNPFFSTKPEGEGTGLGLSVSYGIIKKHGGLISLENKSDGGLIVEIILPMEATTGIKISDDLLDEEERHVAR